MPRVPPQSERGRQSYPLSGRAGAKPLAGHPSALGVRGPQGSWRRSSANAQECGVGLGGQAAARTVQAGSECAPAKAFAQHAAQTTPAPSQSRAPANVEPCPPRGPRSAAGVLPGARGVLRPLLPSGLTRKPSIPSRRYGSSSCSPPARPRNLFSTERTTRRTATCAATVGAAWTRRSRGEVYDAATRCYAAAAPPQRG